MRKRRESRSHNYARPTTNENNPVRAAKSIVDLAKGMVSENRKFAISGMIPRNYEWNKKTLEVNHHLKDMCEIALQ